VHHALTSPTNLALSVVLVRMDLLVTELNATRLVPSKPKTQVSFQMIALFSFFRLLNE